MKFKISKSQWEEMGKKAGWMKVAEKLNYKNPDGTWEEQPQDFKNDNKAREFAKTDPNRKGRNFFIGTKPLTHQENKELEAKERETRKQRLLTPTIRDVIESPPVVLNESDDLEKLSFFSELTKEENIDRQRKKWMLLYTNPTKWLLNNFDYGYHNVPTEVRSDELFNAFKKWNRKKDSPETSEEIKKRKEERERREMGRSINEYHELGLESPWDEPI